MAEHARGDSVGAGQETELIGSEWAVWRPQDLSPLLSSPLWEGRSWPAHCDHSRSCRACACRFRCQPRRQAPGHSTTATPVHCRQDPDRPCWPGLGNRCMLRPSPWASLPLVCDVCVSKGTGAVPSRMVPVTPRGPWFLRGWRCGAIFLETGGECAGGSPCPRDSSTLTPAVSRTGSWRSRGRARPATCCRRGRRPRLP